MSEMMQNLSGGQGSFLLPFHLESCGVRGRYARLTGDLDILLRRHDYPERVAHLVAEGCAMATVLGTAFKFEGVFTLQARSTGPISMLVVDVTSGGVFRACAQFDAQKIAALEEQTPLLADGTLVFTIDQTLKDERYQGVVRLEGEGLAQAFQSYFRQSEQIPTAILVAAGRDEAGHWRASCLMLQRMPREGGEKVPTDSSIEDDWHRVMMLMQTATTGELLDVSLPVEDLLYRLFHEEGVRVHDKLVLSYACRCSRDRIAALLSGLNSDEVDAMKQNGQVAVTCQFCSQSYTFTDEDLSVLRETAKD